MEHIKINLPANEEAYQSGNGEGVWVLVEEDAKKAYDNDESGSIYSGILDNDSVYFPELKHGATIPVEMRGEKRPVTPFEWLKQYGFALFGTEKGADAGRILFEGSKDACKHQAKQMNRQQYESINLDYYNGKIYEHVCVKCGKTFKEPPAISRKDNTTRICSECGTAEALEEYQNAMKEGE